MRIKFFEVIVVARLIPRNAIFKEINIGEEQLDIQFFGRSEGEITP